MSTETADIERIARDILMNSDPAKEWDNTTEERRTEAMAVAIKLHALGYKTSIVHECCATAEAAKPRVLTAAEHYELPAGSIVLAQWADKSQDDMLTMRCEETGTASVDDGYAIIGGRYWDNMTNWGATLTLQHAGPSNE